MRDLARAWEERKKTLGSYLTEAEIEDHRISFYCGAVFYYAILNQSARLPEQQAIFVMNKVDEEINAFLAQRKKLMDERRAEAEKNRPISDIGDTPA